MSLLAQLGPEWFGTSEFRGTVALLVIIFVLLWALTYDPPEG